MSRYQLPENLRTVPANLTAEQAVAFHEAVVDVIAAWAATFPPSENEAGVTGVYNLSPQVRRAVREKAAEVDAYYAGFGSRVSVNRGTGMVGAEVRARLVEEVRTAEAYGDFLAAQLRNTPFSPEATIGITSRVWTTFKSVWPYVFAGAAVLGAGFYWYKKRPKNAKPVFGLFGVGSAHKPRKFRRTKRRKSWK